MVTGTWNDINGTGPDCVDMDECAIPGFVFFVTERSKINFLQCCAEPFFQKKFKNITSIVYEHLFLNRNRKRYRELLKLIYGPICSSHFIFLDNFQ